MKSAIHETTPHSSEVRRLSVLFPTFKLGGAELSQLDVLRKLTARGWKIDILTFNPDGPMADHVPADMTLVGLSGNGRFSRVLHLARWLRTNHSPIVFAFEKSANIILMMAVSLAQLSRHGHGTRTVLCQRFPLSFKRRKDFLLPYLRSAVENRLYRQADRVIAISEGLRDDIFRETGRPIDRIDLIRNPKIDEAFLARYEAPLDAGLHPWIHEAATAGGRSTHLILDPASCTGICSIHEDHLCPARKPSQRRVPRDRHSCGRITGARA